MSTLDDAIMAHMTHGAAAGADPLTDSMLDQLLPYQPALRPGWEDEPVNPPMRWGLLAAVAAATVLLSALLSGCGGDTGPDDGGVVSAFGASTPFTASLTTVHQATIVAHGGKITVLSGGSIGASGSLGGGAGGVILRVELWRGATLLAVGTDLAIIGVGGFYGNGPLSLQPFVDTPGPGAHTYTIKAQWVANGGFPYGVSATTTDASLVLVEHRP